MRSTKHDLNEKVNHLNSLHVINLIIIIDIVIQGLRLAVANKPQTSKNSILADGFSASLAILASENL